MGGVAHCVLLLFCFDSFLFLLFSFVFFSFFLCRFFRSAEEVNGWPADSGRPLPWRRRRRRHGNDEVSHLFFLTRSATLDRVVRTTLPSFTGFFLLLYCCSCCCCCCFKVGLPDLCVVFTGFSRTGRRGPQTFAAFAFLTGIHYRVFFFCFFSSFVFFCSKNQFAYRVFPFGGHARAGLPSFFLLLSFSNFRSVSSKSSVRFCFSVGIFFRRDGEMAGTELIVSFFFFCLHFIFHSSTVFVFVERVAKDVAVMDRFFLPSFVFHKETKREQNEKKNLLGFLVFSPRLAMFYLVLPNFT